MCFLNALQGLFPISPPSLPKVPPNLPPKDPKIVKQMPTERLRNSKSDICFEDGNMNGRASEYWLTATSPC